MKLHRRFMSCYKKNTIAIFVSIVFSLALVTALLIVTHTDSKIKALKNQYLYGAFDVYIDKDETRDQVNILKKNKNIQYLEIQRGKYIIETKGKQSAVVYSANKESISRVSRLLKGRMPQEDNEIVAESWTLRNLGIKTELGTEVILKTKDYNDENNDIKQEKTFKLVGIIDDIPVNKNYGSLELYTFLDNTNYNDLRITIKFKDKVDIEEAIDNISKCIHINVDDIKKNIWLENKSNLVKQDCIILFILLIICTIIIAGIYRISLISRKNQYAILKAIGMKQKQIKRLMIHEIMDIYVCSIPIGVGVGVLCSYLISILSKDRVIIMYFWGQKERFSLVIPYIEVIFCILVIGCVLITIILVANKHVANQEIISSIYQVPENQRIMRCKIPLKTTKFIKSYIKIGFRYVFIDFKTTIFIILSISLGCSLLFGLIYQAKISEVSARNSKNMWYLNCDYRMSSIVDDMVSREGIKAETVDEIRKIDGVKSVETQQAMPIRVVDTNVKRYNRFFNNIVPRVEKNFNISMTGNDGKDQIYVTKIKGYNQSALKKLESFVAEGEYSADQLTGNQVILFIPRTYTSGVDKGKVGCTMSGISTMQYKVGDKIKFKFRTDLDTSSDEYWKLKDRDEQYTEKEFLVSAIVYYPYLKSISVTEKLYPLLIISDKQFSKLFPTLDTYTSVDVITNKNLSIIDYVEIDNTLIDLAIQNQQVVSRSLIEEKSDIDTLYHKEIVYLYGIAIVIFVMVLINVINNLMYRIQIRKQELCIYRAIGVKLNIIRKIICFENMCISTISLIIAFGVSKITGRILFYKSNLCDFGIYYHFDYLVFGYIAIATLIFGYLTSKYLVKEVNGDNIIEYIENVE